LKSPIKVTRLAVVTAQIKLTGLMVFAGDKRGGGRRRGRGTGMVNNPFFRGLDAQLLMVI
jgi:hypothetical protein